MWEAIRETAELDWLKTDAERRLRQLRRRSTASRRCNSASIASRRRTGRMPADWRELVRAGLMPGLPLDTNRTPYVLEPSGRVILSSRLAAVPASR